MGLLYKSNYSKAEFANKKIAVFDSLESLRGLAALTVVMRHVPLWHSWMDFNYIRNAYSIVPFFFVLSGFVIFHSYSSHIKNRTDFLKFMWRRFGRLYPVHLTFLLAFLGIEIVKYIAATTYGIDSYRPPFSKNNIYVFFEHIFLVQALGITNNPFTFNTPSWSISTEFYTYIIFGLSILLLNSKNFLRFSIGIISCSLIGVFLSKLHINHLDTIMYPFTFMLNCLIGFFSGCITYMLFMVLSEKKNLQHFAGISIITTVAFLSYKVNNSEWDLLIYPLSSLIIISVAKAPESFTKTILSLSPLRWLGKISYSLYMSHMVVIWIANQVCRLILKVPSIYIEDAPTPQLSIQQILIVYPLTIITVFFVAWLTYKFIEYPFRERSRKMVVI